MGLQNFFIEGLDPTGLPAFGASEALQLIRAAKTPSYIGMIFVGPAAPDMVSNPQYSTFLWHNTTTGVVSRWTGATWLPISIGIGSLSGTVITDGTLPWTKINLAGSTALYLIRVNAANNALEYVSAANLFGAGSFAVNKLVPGVNGQFLRTVLGAATWSTLDTATVLACLGAGTIPISYIVNAGVADGRILAIDPATHAIGWVDIATLLTIPASNPTIPTLSIWDANGTWTVPAGITRARFRAWGAGGGGGFAGAAVAGGGGGGAYSERTLVVVPGTTYTLNVGVGGVGGISPTDATAGSATTIVIGGITYIQANGGAPGGIANFYIPGAGGAVTGLYTVEVAGEDGNIGSYPASLGHGKGGASPDGGSGGMYLTTVNGKSPGGGGCGGSTIDGGSGNGGNGADGRVIIEY